PDIVILDCRMPHIDGFEISKQLQIIDSNCKIIMITASIIERKNFEDYCDAFFMKPLIAQQLRETANNLVKISR
ncbi:MAG: response regulator, partial [Patescibacteria group bacterium]